MLKNPPTNSRQHDGEESQCLEQGGKPILSFQFGEQQINPNSEIIFISRALLSPYLSKSIIILWKLKNLFLLFYCRNFCIRDAARAWSGEKGK